MTSVNSSASTAKSRFTMEACLLADECVHGPAASNPRMEPMLAELLEKRCSVTRIHHNRLVRTSVSADMRFCRGPTKGRRPLLWPVEPRKVVWVLAGSFADDSRVV